ncbi:MULTISPECIES: hypothetical protein [Flavobacterium]|jgi:hypothetical protein|uniref:DUF4064 domain-containing protein n=1 Tax=Flavobacterium solisilvae TaxID=1852019 RepID=A0ABX1QRZ0_9FLAO|nr:MULTISPECIES: hypothetical protein [Flavobacterium]MBP7319419.1 hypothetical protein [Flavobacterium sp.]NMH23828.1 hypothetical protein [Flavobacterium solisilvae]HLO72750.1 hypothetical protein [Flavobacterium sp.]
MKRNILSVVVGLATAIITFLIAETINGNLHPAPTTLDYKNTIAVRAFYENQPISLWLLVLAGWVIGSLLCGFLIKLISKSDNKKLPIIAGCILTLSAVANFFSLPHPTWFIVVGLLVFIPSTLLGHKLYKLKSNGQ